MDCRHVRILYHRQLHGTVHRHNLPLASRSLTVRLYSADKAGAPAAVRCSALPLFLGMACVSCTFNGPTLCLGYLVVRVFGPEGVPLFYHPNAHTSSHSFSLEL